jgi:hypothetical protein
VPARKADDPTASFTFGAAPAAVVESGGAATAKAAATAPVAGIATTTQTHPPAASALATTPLVVDEEAAPTTTIPTTPAVQPPVEVVWENPTVLAGVRCSFLDPVLRSRVPRLMLGFKPSVRRRAIQ